MPEPEAIVFVVDDDESVRESLGGLIVMGLVVSGLLNKQVAADLGINEGAVKVHRGQVMQKMQAASLADLVRMSEKLGLPRAIIL